jgi:hypothetical protein
MTWTSEELRRALRAGEVPDPDDLVAWPCVTPEGERRVGRCTVPDYLMMFDDAAPTVH